MANSAALDAATARRWIDRVLRIASCSESELEALREAANALVQIEERSGADTTPTRGYRATLNEICDWLLEWMETPAADPIPRLIEIARECPLTNDYYTIDAAMRRLRSRGKILWRSGTRSENRGHWAVRIVATGRVINTRDCPFEAPP